MQTTEVTHVQEERRQVSRDAVLGKGAAAPSPKGGSFLCEKGNRCVSLFWRKLGSVTKSLQSNQSMSHGSERSHSRETIGQFLENAVSMKPEKNQHACQQMITYMLTIHTME